MAPNAKKAVKEEPLTLEDIQKLITMLDKSGLHELDLEIGGARLKLAKPSPPAQPFMLPQQFHSPAPLPQANAAATAQAQPAQTTSPAPAPAAEPAPAPAKPSNVIEVKSPMVGTFYRAPAPGAEPFVKIGDRVRKGQVLCIIEAMKLMNEIEAENDGTIVDILADNAQPVEFGEALFYIEPAS
jgi:acetyl-CoA carboxylase biotin carboxyl carrier protein